MSHSRPRSSFELGLRAGSDGPKSSSTQTTTASLRLPASSPRAISEPLRSCQGSESEAKLSKDGCDSRSCIDAQATLDRTVDQGFFQLGHLLDQFLIAFEDTIVPITRQDSDPFHI